MKKLLILLVLFSSCAVISPLQKSKYLTLSNLIDSGKYTEAKDVVEDMIADKHSQRWPKTWYYKGHLCQAAYAEGSKKSNIALTELYPNQLAEAYSAYTTALALDKRGRLEKLVAPKIIILANDFQKIGEKSFNEKKYDESFSAFEHALNIIRIPALSIQVDTNLLYNTALAAYEAKLWGKATNYLTELHNQKHSKNVSHLLSEAYLQKTDTAMAVKVLYEGAQNFAYPDTLTLLLTDLLYKTNNTEKAHSRLDEAIGKNPNSYTLYSTKGLLYQKKNQYRKAIEYYAKAIELNPKDHEFYVSIATCFYNIGVDIEERSLKLTNNRMVLEHKAKSAEAFKDAISWLDKSSQYGKPKPKTQAKINELYRLLGASDKVEANS